MTLIPHIRQLDCNVISSLCTKKGLSAGSWLNGHQKKILYWSFHKLEPRQDLCVSRLMLSTVNGSGLNCIKWKILTRSTTSSFLISVSSGTQERPSALL